jgi:beta-glucosidase
LSRHRISKSNFNRILYSHFRLLLSQKLGMLYGYGGDYVGDVPVIGPLSDGSYIPAMHLHDGPQGVANGNTQVTCWPSALTVVQSWDRNAMYDFGAGMGKEQFMKGSTVMLGPGVNLARVPWNGRK